MRAVVYVKVAERESPSFLSSKIPKMESETNVTEFGLHHGKIYYQYCTMANGDKGAKSVDGVLSAEWKKKPKCSKITCSVQQKR